MAETFQSAFGNILFRCSNWCLRAQACSTIIKRDSSTNSDMLKRKRESPAGPELCATPGPPEENWPSSRKYLQPALGYTGCPRRRGRGAQRKTTSAAGAADGAARRAGRGVWALLLVTELRHLQELRLRLHRRGHDRRHAGRPERRRLRFSNFFF